MSKRRLNGEGSIRQRQDGRYEVRVSLGLDFATGRPKRVSRYADTEEEAVRILHEMSFLRDTAPNRFAKVTLGEWLDLCLQTYLKPSLKQSTYNTYESYIRVHLKPALGNLLLSELTPRLLQQYYNYKTETEGLAPKTIVNLNLFLHKALSFALHEGLIAMNPAEAINLPRGRKPQIEILTRDEQIQLVRGTYQHRYGVFVRLTLFTGIRLGELLGLRWEDIDVRASMLHIRRTLNRLNKVKRPTTPGECTTEIVIETPKTENSVRSIPLLPAILQDLMTWRRVQEEDRTTAGDSYRDSGMIVTNPLGGFIEPRTFKDYYNQILDLAGLRHFTFHALRHTFASRAMEQGMDAKTLSTLLGHYSVSFTLDTYTHVLDSHKIEGMALMEELLDMAPTATACAYPIIITPLPEGGYWFQAPDFPSLGVEEHDMQLGIELLKEKIQEERLVAVMPVLPTPIEQIDVGQGQLLLQIPV